MRLHDGNPNADLKVEMVALLRVMEGCVTCHHPPHQVMF